MILCEQCKSKSMAAGAMMTAYVCAKCFKGKVHGSTAVPKLCKDCAEEHSRCQRCLSPIKEIPDGRRLVEFSLNKCEPIILPHREAHRIARLLRVNAQGQTYSLLIADNEMAIKYRDIIFEKKKK